MVKLFDNVKMSVSGTPGTGNVALGSAFTAHQSFASAGAVNSDTPISVRFDDTGNAWELSYVTYSTTGPTLTGRTLVDSSTGSLLNLTSAASVACVLFKEDLHTDAIPAFSVHRNNVHQNNIVSGVETKIQFTTEEYDTNNNFDNETNYRFTPTVPGKYLIICVAAMGGLAAGAAVEAIIYRNGTLYKYGSFAACGSTGFSLSIVIAVVSFNGSNDYVEFHAYHDHGSDRNLVGTADGTFASGVWVAP